jgi:Flp pilus assembly pilin Flp
MEDRVEQSVDRRGSLRMQQLSIFSAWVVAKLGIKNERGANLVEYVFLLVFIALVVLIAVTMLGQSVSKKFSTASSSLN